MERAAGGDLTSHVSVEGSDEMARIGRTFETMLGKLSDLVAEVRSASAMVTDVGAALVEDSNHLADRTQAQAASLEETTSAVRAVGDMVRTNAETAQHVTSAPSTPSPSRPTSWRSMPRSRRPARARRGAASPSSPPKCGRSRSAARPPPTRCAA